MTMHVDYLRASAYVARQVAFSEAVGVSLELQQDFLELQKVVENTDGRSALTPVFDVSHSDIGAENGFWLIGRDAAGATVHLQAVRYDDIGSDSLAEFWARNGHWFMTAGFPGRPELSDFSACRYSRQISGGVCYHGEVWLSPDAGVRGKGLGRVLPRIGIMIALMRWSPDYIYGLVHPDVALKGLPLRYGYVHFHPLGIRWARADGEGTLDEYISWMTRDDMLDLLAIG